MLGMSCTSSPAAPKASEASKSFFKQVAEHGEDVIHVHSAAETFKSSSWGVEAELVVLLPFLRVV